MRSAPKWKKYTLLAGVLFLLPIGFSLMLTRAKHTFRPLPYLGEHRVVNGDTGYYTLPSFQFINQDGQPYGTDSLRGKIWVASFFSPSHPFIAKITKRILYIDFRYGHRPDIEQVHFTPTPAADTPEQLRQYLVQTSTDGIYRGHRTFLTGDSLKLDSLMRNAFNLEDPMNDATLWLVDAEGHLRGRFNANTEVEVGDCLDAIARLNKEMKTRTTK